MGRYVFLAFILGVLNTYVVTRLSFYMPGGGMHGGWAAFLIFALLAVEMLPFYISRITIDPGADMPGLRRMLYVFYFGAYAVLGAFLCMLFYVFIGDVVFLSSFAFASAETVDAIKPVIFYGIIAATLVTTAAGIWHAASGPRLVNVPVPIKGLPQDFDGFRIVQISDLHVGPLIRRPYAEKVVKMANDADADMIALTGDMADGLVQELKHHISPLRDLKSREGSFFILGNHEYYWGLDRWLALYESMGMRILLNSHETITRGGSRLVVAGVTDYSTRHMQSPHASSVARAAVNMPDDAVKLLLAHQPTDYKSAAAAGFDLQLSGHTHGGQFFPWSVGFKLFHKYLYGLGRFDDMWIYVTRGAGYWGPPLRAFARSEVVVLTLQRG